MPRFLLALSLSLLLLPSPVVRADALSPADLIESARALGIADLEAALGQLEQARALAQASGEIETLGEAWLAEALLLRERSGYTALQPELETFLAEHTTVLPDRLSILLGAELGNIEYRHGEREAALLRLDALAAAAETEALQAHVRALRGVVHFANADYELAVADYIDALRHFDAVDDPERRMTLNINLGIAWLWLEDLAASERHFQRAQELNDEVEDPATRLRLATNIGILYQQQERFEEAMAAYQQAYALATEANQPLARAQSLLNIATIHNNHRQDFEQALDYYRRSLAIAEAHDLHVGVMLNQMNIGTALSRLGRHDEAIEAFRQARVLIDQFGGPLELRHLYRELSRAQGRMGEYAGALESLAESHRLDREIFDERRDRDISELRIAYEADLKDAELALQAEQLAGARARTYLLIALTAGIGVILVVAILFYRWRLNTLQELYERNRELVRAQYGPAAAPPPRPRAGERLEAPKTANDPEQPELPEFDLEPPEGEPLLDLYQRLEMLMREQQLFTRPDLHIADVATEMGTNQKYLSLAISRHGEGHFNQFLNRHRVNEARRLLSAPGLSMNMATLMQRCGFHTRSTFYEAFKRHTGLTPNQYHQAVCKDRG